MEKITYGFYKSPIGEMVLAQSEKGLCWLGFMVEGYKGNGYDRMVGHFPKADFVQNDDAIQSVGDRLMNAWEQGSIAGIDLDLRGTEFQKSVWQVLLEIKKGQVKTYGDVANDIGKPMAARAVGSAVGSNPVSLIVPCHRVVQQSGDIGNFGWGVDLKRRLLLEEGFRI
ncbi:MAG: hypothetical protein COB36_01675 [Alphaproteobacteria bacterium]|nr:MAG: hypothetical protein COB36_01675 [Alphaproteobacteria bacterium]